MPADTTRENVYNQLVTKVAGLVTDIVAASGVYVAAAPFADTGEKTPYVQIIPGPSSEPHVRSGAGGLRREEFDVAVWVQLFLDRGSAETVLIAGATQGLLRVLSVIDGTAATSGLTNSNLAAVLHGAIKWIRGSGATHDDAHPGWAFATNTYEMFYSVSRVRTVS